MLAIWLFLFLVLFFVNRFFVSLAKGLMCKVYRVVSYNQAAPTSLLPLSIAVS